MIKPNSNMLLAAMIFMIATPLLVPFMPAIEGRFLPVASQMQIQNHIELDDDRTLISGQFTKLRDCTFLSLEWFYGSPDGKHVLIPTILSKPQIRGQGVHYFYGWEVPLSYAVIKNKSFAATTHRCHPFWKTKTHFYP